MIIFNFFFVNDVTLGTAMKPLILLSSLTSALLLTACGGGGGSSNSNTVSNPAPVTPEPPKVEAYAPAQYKTLTDNFKYVKAPLDEVKKILYITLIIG